MLPCYKLRYFRINNYGLGRLESNHHLFIFITALSSQFTASLYLQDTNTQELHHCAMCVLALCCACVVNDWTRLQWLLKILPVAKKLQLYYLLELSKCSVVCLFCN